MVFVKTAIQKIERNETKQNRTKIVRKQTKIATYIENVPTKKEQKYPSKKNHSMDQSVFKSIRS